MMCVHTSQGSIPVIAGNRGTLVAVLKEPSFKFASSAGRHLMMNLAGQGVRHRGALVYLLRIEPILSEFDGAGDDDKEEAAGAKLEPEPEPAPGYDTPSCRFTLDAKFWFNRANHWLFISAATETTDRTAAADANNQSSLN